MNKNIENAHELGKEEVLDLAQVDPSTGLSANEAVDRMERYGSNVLEEAERVSPLKVLFHNVNNIIVYLLILASATAFFMGDPVEGFAVIIAILIAVVSGFFTELKAQKSVEALQDLITTETKVKRDSAVIQTNSGNIVPGDIIFIEEGDSITADARIIESSNFATIESALTGESESVDKDENYLGSKDDPLGDRKNMIYTGTAATRGNAYAVVTATGMDTRIGQISDMLRSSDKERTPLERQLDRLGKTLIIFAAVVAAFVTIFGIIRGNDVAAMIKIGIILAIAAVPEAMPAVSTITLAVGMRTMAGHNALVKSLPAVETLGSTTIICTDKTGTLTENQMTVTRIVLTTGQSYDVEGSGYVPEGDIKPSGRKEVADNDEKLYDMILSGVLCSNASFYMEKNMASIAGDPTEGGIIVLGKKAGIEKDDLYTNGYKRIGEVPFNSREKFMATAYEVPTGGKTVYIKGAPDVLAQMASEHDRSITEKVNGELASMGMRVLSVGRAEGYIGDSSQESIREHIDNGIELLGFLGIFDPPREDVKEAVDIAQKAGIRVIMITGDHPGTAGSIAKKIGMVFNDRVVTGRELDGMNDKELADEIDNTSVFARVSPENKLQIVKALNLKKEVTAMTGDGVNDAPALNGADIGIAMGIRGTQVAKEASDMILTDDRFSTIVKAVKEGRIIFNNIEKFIYFLFSCNVVEIAAIFLAIVFGYAMPVSALQILWLNLVVDILPAMSFAWEAGDENIMLKKPRNPEKAIVTRAFLTKVTILGSLIGVSALLVFIYGINSGMSEAQARTMSFTTMALGQLVQVINVKTEGRRIFDKDFFKNRFMTFALISSVLLQLTVIYLPFFNRVMNTTPMDGFMWLVVIAASILPIVPMRFGRRFFV